MRTWRSAVNKVTGNRFSSTLKTAAATAAVALALSAGAQAPVAAPATVAPAKPVVKPVQKPLDKPLWATLSRPQQVALEPLAGEWDRMEGVRKQKWLEIANRFASMKPDEQGRVHERMREWVKLTPEQRRVARENYTLSKKIDATQKSEQWEKYQQLPEEQKKQLAAEAASARAKKVDQPAAAGAIERQDCRADQAPRAGGSVRARHRQEHGSGDAAVRARPCRGRACHLHHRPPRRSRPKCKIASRRSPRLP